MSDDDQKIRQLVKTWITASKTGDTKTVLNLMTDDVVFMVAGQEPFGKEAFEAASEQQKNMNIEGVPVKLRKLICLADGHTYERT